ncbi:MAG: hypothetical protein EOM64_00025 [Erysipelotrichia bacterium]|nr:hypothetical protein [Erysipelotrichia bacterium]
MNWVMIIPLAIMAYMIIKIISLSKRNKLNRRMLNVLDTFSNDPEGREFYEKCDEYLSTETNVEYLNKVRVLRLWADAFHGRNEDFAKDLESIDLTALIIGDGKGKNGNQIEMNEDSFFYLYLAIPNRLYFRGDKEDAAMHYAKLETIEDQMSSRLVSNISCSCRKYYEQTDDHGAEFFRKVMDGDYGEYSYSKELIGIYKNTVSSMLARIALDEDNKEAFGLQVPELRSFAKSNLGRRFLKELNVVLPEEEEAETAASAEYTDAEKEIDDSIMEVEAEKTAENSKDSTNESEKNNDMENHQ